MECPSCKKILKVNDPVIIGKRIGKWSVGDLSFIVYISKNFVDLEDTNGGKRGKKGRLGVQRIKKEHLICYECEYSMGEI